MTMSDSQRYPWNHLILIIWKRYCSFSRFNSVLIMIIPICFPAVEVLLRVAFPYGYALNFFKIKFLHDVKSIILFKWIFKITKIIDLDCLHITNSLPPPFLLPSAPGDMFTILFFEKRSFRYENDEEISKTKRSFLKTIVFLIKS